jgi:hypothetical protein
VTVDALSLAVRLASVGFLIAGLETISAREIFRAKHPMARSVVSLLHRRPLSPRWDRFLPVLLVCQVASAAWLVVYGPSNMPGAAALLVLAGCVLGVQWRRTLGGDGAEQMGILVVLAGLLAFFPGKSEAVSDVAVLFLTAQLLLSYVTAGVVKMVSPRWRQEAVLADILATHRFGSPRLAGYLRRHPRQCILMQWGVIALELGFPLCLLLSRSALFAFLALALGFHVACAVLMGLNTFVWAFPAVYPCLYVVWSASSPMH